MNLQVTMMCPAQSPLLLNITTRDTTSHVLETERTYLFFLGPRLEVLEIVRCFLGSHLPQWVESVLFYSTTLVVEKCRQGLGIIGTEKRLPRTADQDGRHLGSVVVLLAVGIAAVRAAQVKGNLPSRSACHALTCSIGNDLDFWIATTRCLKARLLVLSLLSHDSACVP